MHNQSQTILIVDDDRAVLLGLGKRLATEGYRVVLAANGDDALRAAAEECPDAALLDVAMPGEIDGMQLAFRLHEDPATARMPIIFVTGSPGEDFKDNCRFVRGKYFITKPYDADVLVQLLRSVLASDELAEMRKISALKRRQPVS